MTYVPALTAPDSCNVKDGQSGQFRIGNYFLIYQILRRICRYRTAAATSFTFPFSRTGFSIRECSMRDVRGEK